MIKRSISRFLRWRDRRRQPQTVFINTYQYRLLFNSQNYRWARRW